MPDISMCINGCKKQESCYRFKATPSDYQSYADFRPDKEGNCDYYWEIKPYK